MIWSMKSRGGLHSLLWIPTTTPLAVGDVKPPDLPLTLAHHVENARKTHRLKLFHDEVAIVSQCSNNNDLNIK